MSQKSNCQPVVSAAVKAASAEAIGRTLTRNPIVAIATAVVASLLDMLGGKTEPGRKAPAGSRQDVGRIPAGTRQEPGSGPAAGRQDPGSGPADASTPGSELLFAISGVSSASRRQRTAGRFNAGTLVQKGGMNHG